MYNKSLVKRLKEIYGERVKFKYSSDFDEELEVKKSIYDIKPTSFYDDVKFIDERCCGKDVKLKKKLDLERIMQESSPDDWDD